MPITQQMKEEHIRQRAIALCDEKIRKLKHQLGRLPKSPGTGVLIKHKQMFEDSIKEKTQLEAQLNEYKNSEIIGAIHAEENNLTNDLERLVAELQKLETKLLEYRETKLSTERKHPEDATKLRFSDLPGLSKFDELKLILNDLLQNAKECLTRSQGLKFDFFGFWNKFDAKFKEFKEFEEFEERLRNIFTDPATGGGKKSLLHTNKSMINNLKEIILELDKIEEIIKKKIYSNTIFQIIDKIIPKQNHFSEEELEERLAELDAENDENDEQFKGFEGGSRKGRRRTTSKKFRKKENNKSKKVNKGSGSKKSNKKNNVN